ncbi:MAG: molybdenum cofactor biosynthesis protein MoaB [Myxococcales bacterium]|nr:MAG: molybdenum cofactor biosynthesis protein MoaB [Myxococcales bacterium]
MAVGEHKENAPSVLSCAVLTVSDTRTVDSDGSGAAIRERLEAAGHRVDDYAIVPDEPAEVAARVRELVAGGAIHAVILNGGTGIAARDNTYEAVTGLLEKRIDGFGELFRSLSYEEIGSSAMLSRAVAGVVGTTIVFALPGSTAACELALDRLIVPELGHIAKLLGHQR